MRVSDQPLDILIVTQMYPGPGAPDLGVFVRGQEDTLRARGHRVRVVAVTRRGGGIVKHLSFALRVLWGVWTKRPQVVYAHFLAPAGVLAAIACRMLPRTALVVVAHGRDVRNIGSNRWIAKAMRLLARRADHVVAVSRYLGDDLERRVPELAGQVQIIDAGVDTTHRFTPGSSDRVWPDGGGASFLFVGTLDDRKNVVRLADAFSRLDEGTLTFVGDGPMRATLEQRHRVQVIGHVEHDEVVTWMRGADVLCLPSIVEPFGQVLIEAMACECSVVATEVGGPPEFVDEQSGVLVDPLSIEDIERGLRAAMLLPQPNVHARERAYEHDVSRQIDRIETLLCDAVARRHSRSRRST